MHRTTLDALIANGDLEGAERMRAKIARDELALADVERRAANIRAGYVYVISNIGAFGENMVKIGMTRRLEPMDRVNELGDASVLFRFDVHACSTLTTQLRPKRCCTRRSRGNASTRQTSEVSSSGSRHTKSSKFSKNTTLNSSNSRNSRRPRNSA